MKINCLPYRITGILLATAMLFSLTACGAAKTQKPQTQETGGQAAAAESGETAGTAGVDEVVGYAEKLFDTSRVHTVDVTISEEDWADLLANPLEKTKYAVNVTVDGETVENVSFATKGNTSLSSVASDEDSDRYSFKINFGKYVDGQTYYGLDKLNLNNLYADATYMKDYLSYQIFRETGVDAPLTSYVWLTVNGEAQGLYLAIEDVGEGWLARTNDGAGELYKPETEMLANMDQAGGAPQFPNGDMQPPQGFDGNGSFPGGDAPELPEGLTPPADIGQHDIDAFPGSTDGAPGDPPSGVPGDFPDGAPDNPPSGAPGGMGFGSDANGADLAYTDDELSSYSDIFDNAETDADEEDMRRVIAALKGLSEGEGLERYLDTDEIIRYFAAHNFVLNYDSYTGSMLHNYYLCENDGKLSMLPWDYNLAFGAFAGGGGQGGGADATVVVNTGIDTPLNGATEDSRPMWSWIASNEEYLAQYHSVMDTLIAGYFESGRLAQELDALYEMLRPYVEQDPSAFYTAEEFDAAYQTLRQFCQLRAESVRAQLDGTLSARTDEQNAAERIDASDVVISAMGSQGGERGAANMPRG